MTISDSTFDCDYEIKSPYMIHLNLLFENRSFVDGRT